MLSIRDIFWRAQQGIRQHFLYCLSTQLLVMLLRERSTSRCVNLRIDAL